MVLRLLILLAIGLFPRLHTSFRYTTRWKQGCSRLRGIKKESYSSESVPFGYSKQLQIEKGRTQVIHGSNAIEHAVNLITEQSSNERRRVLVLTGWNIARVDPLLWELEPRGFTLFVESLSSDDMPSPMDVGHIVNSVLINSIDIVICMGSGGVMDAAKVAVSLLTSHYALHPPNIAWLAQMQSIYSQDEIDISNKDILLVMIPVAPCSGAETSSFSAISPSPVDTRTIHSIPSPSLRFKDYIYCVVPHIAVVQPNLLYRLPMTLLHDRIISLFGAAVEIVLTASDFLQSYLAYDSLQKLSPLLLKSIQVTDTVYLLLYSRYS